MEQPTTGLSESLLNLHERLAVQQSAERGWINQPKPEPEGESKSSPPAGHQRYCSLQSTKAPARLNQDFLRMKFRLFSRPVWKRITKCIKSLSALWEGGRAGECATQWFHGNWRRRGKSGDMKGGQVCLAASQREGLIGKGGTRRKYSKT